MNWMYFSFSLSPAYIKRKIEWVSSIRDKITIDIF